jgi:hypothetical protein
MRRGQTTGPAAATVVLTGLIIVLYLLFLPPAQREALLNNASPITIDDPSIIDPHDRLLMVAPRIVDPIEQRSHSIPLSSFLLQSRTDERSVASYTDVNLMSSRTDKRLLSREISFDHEYIFSNQMIVLNIERTNAPIIVYWNDQRIYHHQPRPGTIIIDNFGRIERSNRIRIEVADPAWWQIFRTNHASITRVDIIARIHDARDAESQQSFVLSREQHENIESAYLRYYPRCQVRPGQLLIRVNSQLMQSQAPDCNRDTQVQIDVHRLTEGRNAIDYLLASGVLHIDSPTIYLTLKRPLEPLYYFEIDAGQWRDIRENRKKGRFEMIFVRGSGQKDIDVIINGRVIRIDTAEDRFVRDITEYMVEGENYIKLQPRRRAETVQMNVFLIAAS